MFPPRGRIPFIFWSHDIVPQTIYQSAGNDYTLFHSFAFTTTQTRWCYFRTQPSSELQSEYQLLKNAFTIIGSTYPQDANNAYYHILICKDKKEWKFVNIQSDESYANGIFLSGISGTNNEWFAFYQNCLDGGFSDGVGYPGTYEFLIFPYANSLSDTLQLNCDDDFQFNYLMTWGKDTMTHNIGSLTFVQLMNNIPPYPVKNNLFSQRVSQVDTIYEHPLDFYFNRANDIYNQILYFDL